MTERPGDHLADPISPASAWNVANALTVLRLLLVPLFVLAAVEGFGEPSTAWRWAASALFVVAAATDLVDGEIARRRHLITTFGKIADPIADKALTGAALIVLSAFNELPWWVTLLILAREILVTVLRFWVIEHGVIAASRGGKLKTLLQIVAIVLYLVPLPDSLSLVPEIAMGLALLVTLVTGLNYVGRALRLRRTALAT